MAIAAVSLHPKDNIVANTSLFQSHARKLPAADAVNSHSAPAYTASAKSNLAQYAMTGCLRSTFYAGAEEQLDTVLSLCREINDLEYVAKLAVQARENGLMKDMPAFLCAYVAANDKGCKILSKIFPRVINNAKMLCTFTQIIRSGAAGRKSFGSGIKRLITEWLDARSDDEVFRASVGKGNPSLADVIRMAHPKPKTASRRALYGYLSARNRSENAVVETDLPALVRDVEAFKRAPDVSELVAPDVPWLLLTSLPLTENHWKQIAYRASWHTIRMNLNTFTRHGVTDDDTLVQYLAQRLSDRVEIARAKVFPYQLLAAYVNTTDVDRRLRDAIQAAAEIATENVPVVEGKIYVLVDVSRSMHDPVTGDIGSATTKMRCIDVAALMAASIVRRNPTAEVVVFSDRIHEGVVLHADNPVIKNSGILTSQPAGGTNCSAAVAWLNAKQRKGDLVVMISDYESWMDASGTQIKSTMGNPTAMMAEWQAFRARNKQAKLACVDLRPNETRQTVDRSDIVSIGGFSDHVFSLLSDFAKGNVTADYWTKTVEAVQL